MTISSTQSYVEYNADGSTTAFTIPFYFLLNSDIYAEVSDTSGNVTELVNGTDFSVTGEGEASGGSLTMSQEYPPGSTIFIYRNPPLTQETAYYENGKFPAKSHEKALDKLTMLLQKLTWWWDKLFLTKPNFLANYYDAKGNRIANLGDPISSQDAATKNYTDTNIGRTLRVPDASIPEMPTLAEMEGKIVAISGGKPIGVLPESGSASDVLIQLAARDGYKLIGECESFDALRNVVPSANGVKIKLRGYRSGSELGGGWFIGSLSAATDNGITIASSGGSYHWVREDIKNIDVFQAGAYGDGSTDDYTYFQAAINYVQTLSLVAGAVTGSVIAPFGYTYKIGTQLVLSVPIKFHVLGNLYWSASSDYAIKVGTGATWNVRYDIYIKNAWADNTLSFPTTINSSGVGLMTVNSMTFSTVKIDTATGFDNRILYLLADGSLDYQQVVQHNTFYLGQFVNSGIGISLLSLDAASSSAQANRFYIQNVYQNYKNIEIDDASHTASNSNTFYINAMDNCRDVGLDLYGHLNHFYIGFAGAPGTALRENSSYGNTIEFGNSVPTDLTIAYGVDARNTILCAHPGTAYLPASVGITSGSSNQNTYGLQIQIFGNVSFTAAGTVQLSIGKDSTDMSIVQTISGATGNSMPVQAVIPPGWYWKLTTTAGTVAYATFAEYAAQ